MKMNKKFRIHKWDPKECRMQISAHLYLFQWELTNKKARFEQSDIDAFVMYLNLDPEPFDAPWAGSDFGIAGSNEMYDLSLFFVDSVNTIYISLLCKDYISKQNFEKLLDELESLDETDDLIGDKENAKRR